MSPWARVIGVFVVTIAAVLLLRVLPPFVVLVIFVGGVTWLNLGLKSRSRRESVQREATLLGLQRSAEDPFGLASYPLALFSRVPEPVVRNVLSGPWRGREVRAFDVAFNAALPGGRAEPRALACALAPVDVDAPGIVVEPSVFVTFVPAPIGAAGAVDPDPPVDVGDDRFHRTFEVRSADAAFARALLDEPMRSWMEGLGEGWGFELRGRMALAYGPSPTRSDVVASLDTLSGWIGHVPDDVAVRWATTSTEGGLPPAAPTAEFGPTGDAPAT